MRLVGTNRHRLVRNIGEVQLDVAEIRFDAGQTLVEWFDLIADALHGVDLRGGVLLVLLEVRDLLRGRCCAAP